MNRWRFVVGFAFGIVLAAVGFSIHDLRFWVVLVAAAVTNEVAYWLGLREAVR